MKEVNYKWNHNSISYLYFQRIATLLISFLCTYFHMLEYKNKLKFSNFENYLVNF